MITCETFFSAFLFLGAINFIITGIENISLKKIRKEFNLEEFHKSNTTLYTHQDCPFIQEKNLHCPPIDVKDEFDAIVESDSWPIRHVCYILGKSDGATVHEVYKNKVFSININHNTQEIKHACPQCVYGIMIPTKYLPHIQKHTSDPRCNHTRPQHEYRQKNNQFKLRVR